MRVKIVSNGLVEGTRLLNAETGEEIDLPFTGITWHLDMRPPIATVSLELHSLLSSIEAEGQVIEIKKGLSTYLVDDTKENGTLIVKHYGWPRSKGKEEDGCESNC